MPLPTPPLPGDQVGPYTLQETVGVGGMATVYLAHSERQGRVALKILHPGKASSDEARRFEREFKALKKLRHPGIVRVFDSGEHIDYPWIAMEYVEGTDLGTLIEQWQKHDPPDRFERVERILRCLGEALSYVHGHGFIHRDLKPSNVLVTKDGRAKLTDFGVVKSTGTFSTELTAAGRLVGTVAFMAPEQITGDTVDARADLYSLGAVLYVLLTFQRPIQADSIAGYLARHLTETPRPPSEVDPRIPEKMERICLKLLRKEAGQRYTSARQLMEALDEGEGAPKTHLLGRDPDVERILRRIHALAPGAGGVTVVLGAVGLGKSTLLQEVIERARIAGHHVVRVSGSERDPLGDLAAQLPIGGPDAIDDADRTPLHGLPLSIDGLASRAGPSSWTFIIDDADAMSKGDVDALALFVRQKIRNDKQPYLLLVSAADAGGDLRAIVGGTATGVRPDVLTLAPLDERATVTLVRDLGLAGEPGQALGQRLHAELQGNPGRIRECVASLVRAGWLTPSPDGLLQPQVPLPELRSGRLPVLDADAEGDESQLFRLPDSARKVLDVTALLGMEASVDLVGEVGQMERAEVDRGIDALVDAKLVRRWVEGSEDVVGLAQPSQRDLVYRGIERRARNALHKNAAKALQRRSRRRVGPLTEVVASHLLRSGEAADAYPMLLQAARWSLRNRGPDEAKALLQQAKEVRTRAEVSLEPPEAVKNRRIFHSLEGEILERAGDLSGALAAWEQAVGAAEEEKDRAAIARALAGVGLVQALRGQADAVAPLERTIRDMPQGDPVWPRVAKALAECRFVKGDVAESQALWKELETLGRETGAVRVEADALTGLGMVALGRGRLQEAVEHLARADQRLQGQGAPAAHAAVLSALAELALTDGRLREARERSRQADGVARDGGLPRAAVLACGLGTQALLAIGEESAAQKLAADATTLARAQGDGLEPRDVLALLPLARTLLALRSEDTLAPLLPKLPPAGSLAADDPVGQLQAIKALLYARREPQRAAELALKALDRPTAPMTAATARLRLDAARALEIVGEPRKAIAAAQSALAPLAPGTFRLLRLEAATICVRSGGGDRHAERQAQLRSELDRELGSPAGFVPTWSAR
jgi:tetratricopeptide (TPR) repeat protein